MKKPISLIMTLCILLVLLSGCGDTQNADTGLPGSITPAVTDSPGSQETEPRESETTYPDEASEAFSLPLTETAEVLTMMYSTHLIIFQYIDDLNEQQFYIEMQKKTGVVIEFITISVLSPMEEFSVIIASGEYPDMLYSQYDQLAVYGGLDYAVESEIILDLADYIDGYAPNYLAAMEMAADYSADFRTDSGYIPQFIQIATSEAPPQGGMAVRQDWLDALGLDAPLTISELTDTLYAFKTEFGPSAAFYSGTTAIANIWTACYDILLTTNPTGETSALDLVMYQMDGVVKYAALEEGFKSALMLANEWYEDGLIHPDFYSITNSIDELEQLVSTDNTGIFYSGATNMTKYESVLATSEDFALSAVPLPRLEKGDVLHYMQYDPVVNTRRGIAITTSCRNVELAVKWCDYCYTEEGSLLANYGVEGVSFEYVDGEPRLTELVTNNPDGISMNFCISLYCLQNGNFIIDYYRTWPTYSESERAWISNWMEPGDDYAFIIPDAVSMTAGESSAYADIMGDITTYVNESYIAFILGIKSFDKWDDFVQMIYDSGIEEAIAIKQDALDRYYSRQ